MLHLLGHVLEKLLRIGGLRAGATCRSRVADDPR